MLRVICLKGLNRAIQTQCQTCVAQFSLNTYPSLKFHNFSNFERWCKRVKLLEVQYL
jgi:hypothetical protein